MTNNETNMTEAEFEAYLSGTLTRVFPWAGPGALTHQQTFTIRLGHKDIELGGRARTAQGRSDILVKQGETPLAILELKRPSIELQEDDVTQGLSYARLVSPPAPLLVVSNGNETHLYDTYTGEKLDDSSIQEEAQLTSLFSNAAEIAKDNKKYAIQTLLGPNDQIWKKVFSDLSLDALDELTGEMSELLSPLVEGFSIPRTITPHLLNELKTNTRRLLVINGPPMSGKTNILAELFRSLEGTSDFVPLFIEADDHSEGVLRIIANRLSSCIGFSFDTEQVRTWLRSASVSESGPTVIIMIDEVNGARIKEELTELTSSSYGNKLRFVVAINDGDPDSLLYRGEQRRKATPLAHRAKLFQVDPLDDVEILSTARVLYDQRVFLEKGYHHSTAYRSPWLLRSLGADAIDSLQGMENTVLAGISPILGLNLFGICGRQFADNPGMKSTYTKLANAIIEEHQDIEKYRSEILHMVHMFLVHEDTIKKHFEHSELRELEKDGLLKKHFLADTLVYIPRLQEYLAFELSRALGELLKIQIESGSDAAKQLSRLSGTIPFGDIIAANAILSSFNQKYISPDFFSELFLKTPKKESIKTNIKVQALIPGQTGGKLEDIQSNSFLLPYDPDDAPVAYNNTDAWLILSHLASMPIAAVAEDGSYARMDAWLMIEVGSCPFPLLRPQSTNQSHHSHDFPNGDTYLCGKDGLIEPITLSIRQSMARDQDLGTVVIQEALKNESLALLTRISIALRTIVEMNDPVASTWAQEQLENKVSPTLSKLMGQAIHNSCPSNSFPAS